MKETEPERTKETSSVGHIQPAYDLGFEDAGRVLSGGGLRGQGLGSVQEIITASTLAVCPIGIQGPSTPVGNSVQTRKRAPASGWMPPAPGHLVLQNKHGCISAFMELLAGALYMHKPSKSVRWPDLTPGTPSHVPHDLPLFKEHNLSLHQLQTKPKVELTCDSHELCI